MKRPLLNPRLEAVPAELRDIEEKFEKLIIVGVRQNHSKSDRRKVENGL